MGPVARTRVVVCDTGGAFVEGGAYHAVPTLSCGARGVAVTRRVWCSVSRARLQSPPQARSRPPGAWHVTRIVG